MADLIAAAKADPAALVYGSWGVRPGHLAPQQLEALSRHPHAPRPTARSRSCIRTWASGEDAVGLRQHSLEPGRLQGRQAALHRGGHAQARPADALDVPTMAEAGVARPGWRSIPSSRCSRPRACRRPSRRRSTRTWRRSSPTPRSAPVSTPRLRRRWPGRPRRSSARPRPSPRSTGELVRRGQHQPRVTARAWLHS